MSACYRTVIAWALSLLVLPALGAGIRQFTPQGEVDRQSRVSVVFYTDMVKLGESDGPAPFAVDCGKVAGTGRWSDSRTWVFALSRSLEAGERCDFRLNKGLKDLSGNDVGGEPGYAFYAPGPWPRRIEPRGGQIAEDQAFLLELSGQVKPASVLANVWCEAEGVGNRIPVRVLSEAERNEILSALRYFRGNHLLALTCAERLPPGSPMRLVWGKDVESLNGTRSQRDQHFPYKVREPFRATFSCDREKATTPCSPLSSLRLEFSGNLDMKTALGIRIVTPEGSRSPAIKDKEGTTGATVRSVDFAGPFPPNASLRVELPPGVKDDAGRQLSNGASFPLTVRTGTLPPLAKFSGPFGIVELKEGGLLPVTLRNVEPSLALRSTRLPGTHRFSDQQLTEDADVIATMEALKKFEQQTNKVKIKRDGKDQEYVDPYYARELPFLAGRKGVQRGELPKPGGSDLFEVVGIPLVKPGFHVVEIESRLLGAALLAAPGPMYVRTTALVTNMAVHLKRGRDNGLVWVTALDTGKPVSGADVRVSDCNGRELWRGTTDGQGRALSDIRFNETLCRNGNFLFASARKDGDYSFVRSDWNEGIESWRFGVETWGDVSPRRIHTVLDRTLFRPGQTVSMKHIARDRNSRGFAYTGAEFLPDRLIIRHSESGSEYTQPLRWDERSSALSQWKIPEGAKRGSYDVVLAGGRSGQAYSGQFFVSDFRLPNYTGSIQGVPSRQVAPKEVPLALGLSFLNGGAAKQQPVQVSATLRPRWPSFKGYESFNFYVDFDEEGRKAFQVDQGREQEQLVLDKQPLALDKAGAGKLKVSLPQKVKGPSELYAEMTFTDPNGEIQTIHGTVELSPAALTVGIAVKDWASTPGSKGSVDVVVLGSADGRPVVGSKVRVVAKRRVDYSHRRRVVGGFYAYENSTEFKDLGEVCAGRTDSRGLLHCEPSVSEAGSVYLLAEVEDDQGNLVRSGTSYWVTNGRSDVWFTAGNQDRIDVIPEKRNYMPGEVARLQVRTPFRDATALVSVEAAGVIDTYVQPLSRFKPVIELPVKPDWGPNVYVSVLAVRGRVQPLTWLSFFQWGWHEPLAWFREWWSPDQPTAMVDLAKPAYRIGLAELGVGTDGFKLKVDVKADRQDYRPRDVAQVQIKVTTPDGKPLPAGSEVTLVAVDQALLELRGNESWQLLDDMLQKRAYEVETATAQSQVIGKRHFGRKALPAGGGGGRAPARELFDTLLSWQPRVRLDANGSATVSVPLNDSLSEFRIVAVADAGPALFGTGDTRIRTKQDLQMISGLPPQVREGDRYQALLTLRNGTARAMTVSVSAKMGGQALDAREVTLEAEGAAELAWNAKTPEGSVSQTWEFDAQEKSGSARDRLKIEQQINPAVPVTVQQATFGRIEGKWELPLQMPTGALPGKGGLEVSLSPRLSTPPTGLRRYFEAYPFSCLEQRTSIAIGLHDPKRWQAVADSLPAYLDGNGLARYFPGEGPGSVALTAYLLDATLAAGLTLPDDARQRMEQGLVAFLDGRLRETAWAPLDDLPARRLSALAALSRAGQKPLRAAAAMEVEPLRLPTSALIDWYQTLRRLTEIPDRAKKLAAVDRELRNRLSYTGGRLMFTTENSDYWWWLMISGNANSFRLIDAVLDEPAWQADLPALMQGAMLRQQRGHWGTTVANVWATIALGRFGRKFENEAVKGSTKAAVIPVGEPVAFDWRNWKADGEPPRLSLPWPAKLPADAKLALHHEGSGKPWATVQLLAAMPNTQPRAFGYRLSRSVTPLQEKEKGKVSRGDLWRVTLTIDAEQDMTWVALSDSIPAGAKVLGDGDNRDSAIAQQGESRDWRKPWPAYVERTFAAYRAYYAYVPKGRFTVDYTLRINNAGEFNLPPARIEAMYAPDVFGETTIGKVVVGN